MYGAQKVLIDNAIQQRQYLQNIYGPKKLTCCYRSVDTLAAGPPLVQSLQGFAVCHSLASARFVLESCVYRAYAAFRALVLRPALLSAPFTPGAKTS